MLGFVTEFTDAIGSLIGDPDFRAQLSTIFNPTKIPYLVVVIGVTTKLARNRTLDPAPPVSRRGED